MNRSRFLWYPALLAFACCGTIIIADAADRNSKPGQTWQPDPRALALADDLPAVDGRQYRDLVLKTIDLADLIPDPRARAAAQWQIVQPLVQCGLIDLAFQQAMKLRTVNPQTCIYSLGTIAQDARKRDDQKQVDKAWNATIDVNTDGGKTFNHYVIELGFQLDRPLEQMIAIAAVVKPYGRSSAFCDVRNELAARGRVKDAYRIAETYLTAIPKTIHDREIAYRCVSAKQLVENAAPDHIEQAVRIIQQMPEGEHRDFVIGSLIENLLVVTDTQTVSDDRIAIAEKWVVQIRDEVKRAAALRSIMRRSLPKLSVAELEQKLTEVRLREVKDELLSRIFHAQLDEGRLEDADAILSRRLQLIRDQPRPETRSAFGSFNDDDAIRLTKWMHEKEMVSALIKADRKQEARSRIESMKDLPEAPPAIFLGNLEGIRLALYWEMNDFDSVEKSITERPAPAERGGGMASLAARFMEQGQPERALKYLDPILEMSPEQLFPSSTPSLYFAVEPYSQLAMALFRAGQTDQAMRVLAKIPEHERMAHAFEALGQTLVQMGRLTELDQWLDCLPHHTARTGACMGAIHELSKVKERS